MFTNTTLNHLGFGILTVGTPIFHLLYFELHLLIFVWSNIVGIRRKVPYSEGKIHKSDLEPRNSNANTVYFTHQGNTQISHTECLQ